jgi:hypothetical protein
VAARGCGDLRRHHLELHAHGRRRRCAHERADHRHRRRLRELEHRHGTARFGANLKASTGTWDLPGLTYSYQWLRDGTAIKGATASSYTLTSSDVGKRVSVRVTAKRAGHGNGTATSTSTAKVAKVSSSVKASVKDVTVGKRATVKVTVTTPRYATPSGTLTVRYGSRSVKVALKPGAKGKASVRLPALAKGKHAVTVTFTPDKTTGAVTSKATSKKVTLRVL